MLHLVDFFGKDWLLLYDLRKLNRYVNYIPQGELQNDWVLPNKLESQLDFTLYRILVNCPSYKTRMKKLLFKDKKKFY